MILYGEDILQDDEIYRSIAAKGTEDDSLVIRYLQPRDEFMYGQEAHESALDYLFEQEEDLKVLKRGLTADETG